MAYIGRDTDKISNVEVLDNITFDGSSSYTLQKNSVNFTPSSANTLLVSIDGVVQAGNFTVSGSTIDFGTAVAGTSTCDFILHYGVGLITTPSDGTVTTAKLGDNAVTSAKLANSSVTTTKLNDASVSLAKLSATGTKDATTFLRGDNTFTVPGGGDYVKLSSGTTQSVSQVIFENSVFDSNYSTHIIELNIASSSNSDSGYVDMFWDDATTFSSGFTNVSSISLQMNSSNTSPEMSGGEENNGVMRIATDGWRSNAGPQPIIIECHNLRTTDLKYFYWRALHLNMDANHRLIVNYGGGVARSVSTNSSLKFAAQNGWNFSQSKYAVYGVK
nr:hypothetical protein [uncultured Mediterranean phage uvMED]